MSFRVVECRSCQPAWRHQHPVDMADTARRDQLSEYLASSRAVQRTMIWVGLVGLGLALALGLGGAAGRVVFGILAIDAIVVGASVWITHGHIEDFRHQLEALERGGRR